MANLEANATCHDASTQQMLAESQQKYVDIISIHPYITTMTVCFFLSKPPKSLDLVAEFVAEPFTDIGRILIDEVFGGKNVFFARPSSRCFPNCVVFTLIETNSRNLAIKCFTNGTLHITGVDNVSRGLEIADMFGALLDIVEGGNGCNPTFKVDRFELQLMNIHSRIDVGKGRIDLNKLFEIVLRTTQHMSSYNKERHNGLIIKILTESMHTVSVIVFDSGNILICACRDATSFKEAYGFIISVLQSVWHDVWQKDVLNLEVEGKKRKRKQKDNFDYGQYIILS